MTTEAAYAKLVVLLSEGRAPDEVRALFTQDLAGELAYVASRSSRSSSPPANARCPAASRGHSSDGAVPVELEVVAVGSEM